jgi:hypothetical protein
MEPCKFLLLSDFRPNMVLLLVMFSQWGLLTVPDSTYINWWKSIYGIEVGLSKIRNQGRIEAGRTRRFRWWSVPRNGPSPTWPNSCTRSYAEQLDG